MFNKLLMVAAFAATAALPAQASAFRACEDYNVDTTLEANWPDFTSADRPAGTTPGRFGTKRWSFKYQYTSEGFELLDATHCRPNTTAVRRNAGRRRSADEKSVVGWNMVGSAVQRAP